jgi:hypothetical protein
MAYKITSGDLEITKNVLMQLSIDTYKKLEKERNITEYETECPSYDVYQALVDALCVIEKQRTLTK